MSIYTKNLEINSHSDFEENFELTQLAGKPTDLTGHSVASHMRRYPDSTSFTAFTVGITSAADGKISIGMSAPVTSTLKSGKYVYDLMIIRPGGAKVIVLEGTVTVNPGFSLNCP
tara:strand:+ start:32 stop:376 length:345 start_codon:yes stop_codon:yes gene_type:complete